MIYNKTVCCDGKRVRIEVDKTDAHLITNDPELLAACKQLLKDLEQDFEMTANELQSAYEMRKAIAKTERRDEG